MNERLVDSVVTTGNAVAADLSPLGLFLQADIVVKVVMIGLLLASIWSWAIIIDKLIRVRRLNRAADRFEENFWSGEPLDRLFERVGDKPTDPMSAVFAAGMREYRRSPSGATIRTQERIERAMQVTVQRELTAAERNLTFLASVGSTAPFVGLFGTVWGIMNSFASIAASKNTNLAVVAPGIAEALFATALGLVAAIPAVLGYNKVSGDLNRYAARLDSFASEFSTILTRDMNDGA